MKKHTRGIILTVFILFCLISIFGCGKKQTGGAQDVVQESDDVREQDVEQEQSDVWQQEEYLNGYANPQGNRITYADGYYYYASQLDNYFLYRAKEDGSDAKCLAKVHSGSILADGDVLYFVNLSDDKAIYRIGTDGSDMRKICGNSYNKIQMSAEYIYFCDTYEREADIRGLFSAEEAEEIEAEDEYLRDDVFYRIRKDGSGKEILRKIAWSSRIAGENGEKVMYDGYFYCWRQQWNEENEQWETFISRYDLDVENEEEICRFEFYGNNLIVCGDRIYCFSTWGNVGKIGEYIIGENEVKYLPEKELTDCCVYNGALYGIVEDTDEDSRSTRIYKLNEGETQWEEIYHNDAECSFFDGSVWETRLTDIYATEQGVFFRQFVSPEEGVKWFSLGEEDNAGKWEDENVIPIVKQASMLEYNNPESYSIKPTVNSKSTNGYEDYLGEDLTYEEFYGVDEEGEGYIPYRIRLPQFNEKIEGYREINAYFQSVYKEALVEKEEFFDMLDENRTDDEDGVGFSIPVTMSAYESMDYDYVYIGEKYITIAKYRKGYWYGTGGAGWQQPVTFERKTGRVVTLEDFFGDEPGEAVARVTASIYKYMENGERDYYNHRKYFLKDEDVMTEEFIPEQFFLFPEGIGIYYRAYAIGSGAEGDFVFIVPYPDWQPEQEEYLNGYANPQGNRITYADGYYYYASQLDNYFLYRVKEDGSDAKCLAKVHSGSILVDGDILYFVNLSDNKSIYRIGTDGSDLQKVCDNSSNNIKMSAEYIYFYDTYEREADIRGLFSEEEAEEIEAEDEYLRDNVFYRIRKDGSGKEILYKTALACTLAATNGEKTMYDGYLYCRRTQRNEETEQEETLIRRYDLNVENKEEICRFDFDVDSLIVCGDRIYCFGAWESAGKIGEYIIGENEVKYLPDKELTDFCVYNGVLYGIVEDVDEDSRLTRVYKLEEGETEWEEIYRNDAECAFYDDVYWETSMTDIYATEQGVFFRQFVSPEEGVKWFSLSDTDNVVKWEDENVIPITKQASMMEDDTYDYSSVKSLFRSTSGYKAYLGEDLTYEEFYRVDEEGEGHNPYSIRLPQFNEIIEGYREINAYFQNAYQEALGYKEEFFDMLDEESEKSENGFPSTMLFERTDYDYVYIGEKYITVAKYQMGYWGGIRDWYLQEPVTFERKTGRVVTLEEFFGDEPGEAVARATAAVYKYMENGERGYRKYFLKDEDTLTEEFDPEQFFLFPEGIGIYYVRYAIGSGADGDFVFIVPYPD